MKSKILVAMALIGLILLPTSCKKEYDYSQDENVMEEVQLNNQEELTLGKVTLVLEENIADVLLEDLYDEIVSASLSTVLAATDGTNKSGENTIVGFDSESDFTSFLRSQITFKDGKKPTVANKINLDPCIMAYIIVGISILQDYIEVVSEYGGLGCEWNEGSPCFEHIQTSFNNALSNIETAMTALSNCLSN